MASKRTKRAVKWAAAIKKRKAHIARARSHGVLPSGGSSLGGGYRITGKARLPNPKKKSAKAPSAAQLRARANFIKMVKERARLRAAGKLPPTTRKVKAAKVKRKVGKPSPAQLAARAKFVAMVRAKAAKKNGRGFSTAPPSWVRGTKKKATKRKAKNPAILRLTEAQAKAYGGKIKGLSAPARTARTRSISSSPRKKATKKFKKVGIFGGSGFLGLGKSIQTIKRNPSLVAKIRKLIAGSGKRKPAKVGTRRTQRGRHTAAPVGYRRTQRGKRNPAPASVFSEFRGKSVTRKTKVKAASGTPSTLAQLGKLRELKLRGKVLKFRAGHLAADGRKKLHIVGIKAKHRNNPGGEVDYGEIISVTYEADKPHVETGVFNYVHRFGEDGGTRPHLVVDPEGYMKVEGGSYKISADGIID